VSNHDELMSNFFAQPDALAYGKVSFMLSPVRYVFLMYELEVFQRMKCS
jgi:hypothetical protein